MSIILYTQPRCGYCDLMKEMLDKIGQKYETIDISVTPAAKEFLLYEGHKTVPQLYNKTTHLNKKPTQDYTTEELSNIIAESLNEWPWQDSGIEQGI